MRKKAILIFLVLLTTPFLLFCQQQNRRVIDSAKKAAYKNSKNDSLFLQSSFFIAEEYMAVDMYDSAQIWLNNIASRLPLRKPSFFNFYLSVDQAETYYFTGLMQMDLQESERTLRIAKEMNDSIFLATGYNFVGLAHMNLDSIRKGIPYLQTGIRYAKQPPYPPRYISGSKPHHLLGNLAEAYYRLGVYDSAAMIAYRARKFAAEIPSYRGMAVADNLLGLIYAATNSVDSAIQFQKGSIALGLANNNPDVSLIAYSALAGCFQLKGRHDSALAYLETGFRLLEEQPLINGFFTNQFLADAIRLYKLLDKPSLLVNAMEMKAALAVKLAKKNDAQVSLLVKGSVANELRAANLEVTEARQKQALSNTRLLIALLTIISLVVLFIIYRYYHKKQLKEIEIRNKISRDLHDDIGATLSSIKIYGELAHTVLDDKPDQSKAMIGKITEQSKDLMQRMGDVIWSMKSTDETQNSFTTRINNYCSELLAPKGITCEIEIDDAMCSKITNPITRKHILLIVKEALNNIAKYSGATHTFISFKQADGKLVLIIQDNGKGFTNPESMNGNGLGNIRQRCEQCNGSCKIESVPGKGVTITAVFPIAIFNYTE